MDGPDVVPTIVVTGSGEAVAKKRAHAPPLPTSGPVCGRRAQTTAVRPRVPPLGEHEDTANDATLNGHSHLPVCLGAIGVVGLLYASLAMCLSRDSWAYKFLFERSFVQWVTLYVFLFGLGVLAGRLLVYAREARALARLKSGVEAEARGSVAWQRYSRLQSFVRTRASEDVQPYATYLAESDAAELDSGYCLLGDVVQMLPLLGFFGTVLGLTVGLQKQFLSQVVEGRAFGQAIATAFDTTLLGLACTILMVLVQRPLRKREEGLLAELDRFVDARIVRSSPRSAPASGPQEWAQGALVEFSRRMAESGRALAAEARQGLVAACEGPFQALARRVGDAASSAAAAACRDIAAAASGVMQTVRAEMGAIAERVAATMAEKRPPLSPEQAAALAQPVASALKGALVGFEARVAMIQQHVAGIAASDGKAAEALSAAVRDSMAALGDRMSRIVARPRRISLVETPWSDNEVPSKEAADVAPKA